MHLDPDQKRVLGISNLEEKVLQACSKTPLTISALARTCAIPRTTVRRVLERLKERGWVNRDMTGSYPRWKVTSLSHLQKLFTDSTTIQKESFDPQLHVASNQVRLQLNNTTEFAVHQGRDRMVKILELLVHLTHKQTIHIIESSVVAAQVLQKVPHDQLVDINAALRSNRSIIYSINPQDYYVHALSRANREWLASMDGRLQTNYIVPNGVVDGMSQMLIFNNRLFFLNWEQEIAFEVADPQTIALQKTLFEQLSLLGRKKHNSDVIKEVMKYCSE